MLSSASLLFTRRVAISQAKRRLFSNVSITGDAPPATNLVRRKVSLAERAKLREERRERATRLLQQSQGGGGASSAAGTPGGGSANATASKSAAWRTMLSRLMVPVGLGLPTVLLVWGVSDPDSPPAKFSEFIGLTALIDSIMDRFSRPAHDKLLPDWSMMPNVPHDIPVPHTLVLDLENTLVSSTWDRKHGWRHAKRPGVDKFLLEMAQYYEIVLYSPSQDALADPVVTALDKNGCILHRLYRDATYYKNGIHVKDLKSLNRNVKRMVILDDDPLEVQFQPENLIRVKPYTDPNDFSDRTLARITPFLIEIARENYQDIPALLSQYKGMDADQIADEFEKRIVEYKQDRERHLQRGLAGMVRRSRDLPPPELQPVDPFFTSTTPTMLTSKDLVGPAPETEASGLMGWLNKRAKEKEENQKLKIEQWNEIMHKRHKEQQEAERKAKEAAAAESPHS